MYWIAKIICAGSSKLNQIKNAVCQFDLKFRRGRHYFSSTCSNIYIYIYIYKYLHMKCKYLHMKQDYPTGSSCAVDTDASLFSSSFWLDVSFPNIISYSLVAYSFYRNCRLLRIRFQHYWLSIGRKLVSEKFFVLKILRDSDSKIISSF